MVSFNAGDLHGVKAVQTGSRCAIALWFTMDESFREVARDDAELFLRSLSPSPISSNALGDGPAARDEL
jgi:leucine proline-enriched proteoglycan (leprecan)